MHRESTTTTSNKSSSGNKTTGVYSIAEDSWWKVLYTSTIIDDTRNQMFKLTHAPTVAEEETKYVPQKFEVAEKFYRPVFERIMKRKM